MWPSFTVRVLQDIDRLQIAAQFVSAISIIIASGLAVWYSGRKDRIEAKKKTEYYESVLDFLNAKLGIATDLIMKSKDTLENSTLLAFIFDCETDVQNLKRDILDFNTYSPKAGITRRLLFFVYHYQALLNLLNEFPRVASSSEYEQICDQSKRALMLIDDIYKAYRRKIKWYERMLNKRSRILSSIDQMENKLNPSDSNTEKVGLKK